MLVDLFQLRKIIYFTHIFNAHSRVIIGSFYIKYFK